RPADVRLVLELEGMDDLPRLPLVRDDRPRPRERRRIGEARRADDGFCAAGFIQPRNLPIVARELDRADGAAGRRHRPDRSPAIETDSARAQAGKTLAADRTIRREDRLLERDPECPQRADESLSRGERSRDGP